MTKDDALELLMVISHLETVAMVIKADVYAPGAVDWEIVERAVEMLRSEILEEGQEIARIVADQVPDAGKMMEDVQTVRADVQAIIGICDGTRGPEDHNRDPYETIADYAKNTLAVLDRIVGKEE